jgi:uncharacterized membrane protein (UPF0136 family)
MSSALFAAIAYGLLALIGGIYGYIKVRSVPSLVSGVVSGLILLVGALLQTQGNPLGLTLSAIVTGVLLVVFAIRWVKTQKFMPAGLMCLAGVIALGTLVSALI